MVLAELPPVPFSSSPSSTSASLPYLSSPAAEAFSLSSRALSTELVVVVTAFFLFDLAGFTLLSCDEALLLFFFVTSFADLVATSSPPVDNVVDLAAALFTCLPIDLVSSLPVATLLKIEEVGAVFESLLAEAPEALDVDVVLAVTDIELKC